MRDLRFALRSLRRSPGFTCAALAALALGIGSNTAIFSVVNAVLLKPLSYPDPDRIVQFLLKAPSGYGVGASATTFHIWREQTSVFQDVSAYRVGSINLTGGANPEQIPMAQVSADCFRLFGAPFLQGRGFTAEEDRPNGGRVAVLNYGFWKRRFHGDPHAAGKVILLGGEPYTIVGVLGPGFDFDSDPPPDVWLPFQLDPNSTDQASYFAAAARLKPGVTLAMANARLALAAAQFRRKFPIVVGVRDGFAVELLRDRFVEDVRSSLLILTAAVGLGLLIACANVANLLLVRAGARRREIAIRAAIGAGRARIFRQLLTESLVLSAAGGALGLFLGLAGVQALLAIHPGDIPRIPEHGAAVAMDWRVLLFTVLLSLGTGIIFGLIPALGASRADLGAALKEGSARSGTGFRQNKSRSLLVAGETAVAVVLLIGAALLIRSFHNLRSVDPGFEPHDVLTLRMSLANSPFQTTAAAARLVRDAAQDIDALPGVAAAAATSSLPLEGGAGLPFTIFGRPVPSGTSLGRVGWMSISPGYFKVFKIPIVSGRAFTDRDSAGALPVVMINRAMARRFWPGANPAGARVLIGQGYGPEFADSPRQVIGVVGDVRDDGLNRDPEPMFYVPIAQVPDGLTALIARVMPIAWAVRTRVEPHSVAPAIERELIRASGGLPAASVLTMDEISARSTARARFDTLLLSLFGASALLLAAIGIYGSMAYSVEQRRQEIGIRLALGARPAQVRTMVVFQGLRLALAGAAAGLAASFVLARVLAGFLFGVPAHDPAVFLAVPTLLSAVALAAAWMPAVSASRVDPAVALRSE